MRGGNCPLEDRQTPRTPCEVFCFKPGHVRVRASRTEIGQVVKPAYYAVWLLLRLIYCDSKRRPPPSVAYEVVVGLLVKLLCSPLLARDALTCSRLL